MATALAITGFKGDAKQIGEQVADLVRKHQEHIYERFANLTLFLTACVGVKII